MGGGTSTTTQGSIDPALRPLFTGSSQRLLGLQQQSPVEPFTGQYPMQVSGPNQLEQYGASQIYGLDDANPMDAMALQDIMRMGEYAYAGPTTGQPNSANDMDLSSLLGMLNSNQQGVFPEGYGQSPTQPMGPAPGPLPPGANDPAPGHYHDPYTGINHPPQDSSAPPGTMSINAQQSGSPQLQQQAGAPRMDVNNIGPRQQTPQTIPPGNRPPADNDPRTGTPGGPPAFGGPPPTDDRSQMIGVTGGPGRTVVADMNAANHQGTTGETPFNQSPGMQAGYARVSGQQIADDPAIAAAMADFQRTVQPGIQNQAALAGLGNSNAMVNSIGQAQGSMLTPLYQDAFAREQHTQDRGYGATEEELARRERANVRRSEANTSAIDRLMAMSQMQTGRRAGASDAALQAGGTFRGYQQAGNESSYNDMLRRQALSESALYTPFGGMLPSAFGSRQVSTGK